MPQMMLMARKRIHPRELTYLPYETWTNEIPGWRPRWPTRASSPTSRSSTPRQRPRSRPPNSSGARAARSNSLVFDCDGEPLLVLASGADRVDTELLARALGAAAINKANPQ